MADLNDDIAKYLSGKLTPAEMHALERKALNDPFLAEALEGASGLSSAEYRHDISSLQSQLHNRTQRSRTLPLSPWAWPLRIAAGLLLLVSATVAIIKVNNNESRTDIALNSPMKTAPEPSAVPPAPLMDSSESESTPEKNTLKDTGRASRLDKETTPGRNDLKDVKDTRLALRDEAKDAPKVAKRPPNAKSADNPTEPERSAAAPVPKTEEIHSAAEIVVEELAQAKQEAKSAQALPQPAQASRFSLRESDKADERMKKSAGASALVDDAARPTRRMINGQVKSTDGSELPGVNVNIKGTNIGTVTDIDGNFKIPVNATDTTLVFSYIGYASTEKPAGMDLKVELAEDATQLSEVVVTGYGVERDADEITSTLELAGPIGGKKAFTKYLEKNMRYPQEAVAARIEGRVTIEFTVEITGALTDFTVIKGIGGGCDEELMRLIMTGPKWTPTKKDSDLLRDLVRVRMRFQLPKK